MGVRVEEGSVHGAEGDAIDVLFFASEEEDAEPGPGIVLVHEVYGVDHHQRDVARRFAAEGFRVALPDLYSRAGTPGPVSTDAEPAPAWELDTIRAAVAGLPDRRALADLESAAAALEARDDVERGSVAAVGFCMGGTLAFLLGCTSRRIAAVVDFYGGPLYDELTAEKPIQPLELALNLDRPFLGLFAEEDEHVPLENVERLREMLSSGAKTFDIVTYPTAGHGFFNELRPNYDEARARDAWDRTLGFLREVL